jgi:hypothetical protein
VSTRIEVRRHQAHLYGGWGAFRGEGSGDALTCYSNTTRIITTNSTAIPRVMSNIMNVLNEGNMEFAWMVSCCAVSQNDIY